MLGHSIVFQHFMELEGSIPNSQELSTCSYPHYFSENLVVPGIDPGPLDL
jgi:hypothetical protein